MGRIDQWGLVAIKVVSEFDHRCWSIESNCERDTLRTSGWVEFRFVSYTWKEIGRARGRGICDDNNHLMRALTKSYASAAGSLIMIINISYSSVSHTNELQREVRKSGFAPLQVFDSLCIQFLGFNDNFSTSSLCQWLKILIFHNLREFQT